MKSALVQAAEGYDASAHGHGGLTIFTTAVFAVGEMAGSGVLALPSALLGTGISGIMLNVMCAIISAFTGALLGKCWVMILERYEEFREQVRNPYTVIGHIAAGRFGRYLVSVCINANLFGVAVVFLLIASENIQTLVKEAGKEISFCYWLFIVAAILCPITWLGTPKDFWPIAVGAVVATSLACVLIFAKMMEDNVHTDHVPYTPPLTFKGFFTAFGTICFAFGGHPAFPTFQADMKKPEDFGKAISLSYLIVLLMYLPVAVAGYYTYGGDITSNILSSISEGPIRVIVTILITLHLIFGFVIVINPVCQEFEEMLGIPKQFNFKRAIFRTVMMLIVLFVALSIPSFGAILSLIGGSMVTLLAYILPPLFYLRLSYMEGDWEIQQVPLHIKVASVIIMVIGVISGISSTYSAIDAIASSHFSTPCYVKINQTPS